MKPQIRVALLLLLTPIVAGGCFRATQLESLCEDISWQFPDADFHREISFSLGSIPLGAAKFAAGFTDDTREAREYLAGIRHIDVAVYEIRHLEYPEDVTLPDRLQDLLDDDWEIVVKSREEDERVWILFREEDDAIRDLHITVLSPDELVMVQLSGDLSDVFERVLEDHHGLVTAVSP